MERITYRLIRVENEENQDLDACKLLGAPVLAKGLFEALHLKDTEYFIAQINCAQVKNPPFPEKGWLYFFLDVESLKPRVVYTEKDPAEVIDDINEPFDADAYGDPTCLKMEFPGEKGSFLFGENDPDIGLEGSTGTAMKLTLLQIDALALPQGKQKPLRFGDFGFGDGHWVFLIEEKDLEKRDFRHVEFVEVES